MKVLTAILVLIGCHQICAAGLPASLLSAKAKLAELKMNLDIEIAALPAMPEFKSFKPRAPVAAAASGLVPDFADRIVTLENLKTKITELQATQKKDSRPNPAFFAEMQKTLEESMTVKLMAVEVPKYNPNAAKPKKRKSSAVAKNMPKVQKKIRNLTNFTEEITRLGEAGADLHRLMLEGTRVERNDMVEVVYDIFNDMVYTLGSTTEEMWTIQASVQKAIDYDESIGAVADCVNEQVTKFQQANERYGSDLSFCSSYVYSRALSYLRSIFYPTLERTMSLISPMQYLILQATAFTNIARDQEALIEFVEGELHSIEEFWNQNILVFLGWESNRYDDEMLRYREELSECVGYTVNSYGRVAGEIITALNNCAVPTRNRRPMQLKPTA